MSKVIQEVNHKVRVCSYSYLLDLGKQGLKDLITIKPSSEDIYAVYLTPTGAVGLKHSTLHACLQGLRSEPLYGGVSEIQSQTRKSEMFMFKTSFSRSAFGRLMYYYCIVSGGSMLLLDESKPISTSELQMLPCTILVATTDALEVLFRGLDKNYGLQMIKSVRNIRLERPLPKGKKTTFSTATPSPKIFKKLFGNLRRAFVHGPPLKNSAVLWAQYAIGNVFQFFGPVETHCVMFVQKTVTGPAEDLFAFFSYFRPKLVAKPDDKNAVELTVALEDDSAACSGLRVGTGFIFTVDSSGDPVSLKSHPGLE